MRFFQAIGTLLLACTAAAVPSRSESGRINSPDDRSCWGDYDISTNYYEEVPDTGVVREYWFNLVNTTASPDGVERMVLTVNGTIPGPTIIADWGDTIVVHVTNSLENNGSSIHFHGIRQNYTSQMDGVASITQCPIAPGGGTYTYRWRATQYGTSWWHSHFYVQAWDGVFGGIIINGPATANYDEDLGNLFLMDWSHSSADVNVAYAQLHGLPTLENGLINGTNVYGDLGKRFETHFEPGKRYRIRLVNVGADTFFKFTIDNHMLEVIATDFVPIVPYTTDVVSIGMGQRYDVIVTANAKPDNYWLRAIAQSTCSENDNGDNIMGIVRYDERSTADPTSHACEAAAVDDCNDEDMSLLVPYVPINPSSTPDVTDNFNVSISIGQNGVYWRMGSTSMVSQWGYPTALQSYDGNSSWSAQQQVFSFPDADTWVYWVIETTSPASHPMHLHGHDFWILSQGAGNYSATTTELNFDNPPRRDVVQLPGGGHVVIAFKTDNPGVWLMHCHIAWHTSEGLAVQVVERESEFLDTLDPELLTDTCAAWNDYTTRVALHQDDSGI
ncbi:laccase 3 [Xylariales sp. PMI_506]|nr:laccase 3 [Xylariales sp. PMI_506]